MSQETTLRDMFIVFIGYLMHLIGSYAADLALPTDGRYERVLGHFKANCANCVRSLSERLNNSKTLLLLTIECVVCVMVTIFVLAAITVLIRIVEPLKHWSCRTRKDRNNRRSLSQEEN